MRIISILVLILFWSQTSLAEEFLYPKKGQSAEQQDKDKYECHQWAVGQTGFDPMNPPKAPDATPQVAAATVQAGRRGSWGSARGSRWGSGGRNSG